MIRAEVPMAEMLTYGTTLTSITQGRGSFRIEMDHYDLVPQAIAEKILAERRSRWRTRRRSKADDTVSSIIGSVIQVQSVVLDREPGCTKAHGESRGAVQYIAGRPR